MQAASRNALKTAVYVAALLLVGIGPAAAADESEPSAFCPNGGIRIHAPSKAICGDLYEAAGTEDARKHKYVPFGDMGPFDQERFKEFLEAHEDYKKKFKDAEWSEQDAGYCMICYVREDEEIDIEELIDELDDDEPGDAADADGGEGADEAVEDKVKDGGPPCPTKRCQPRLGNSQPWSCEPFVPGDADTCPGGYPESNYAETCCLQF